MNNTLATLKLPGAVKGEIARQEQWEELRSVFPIYLALARHLEFEIPFGPDRRNLPAKADSDLFAEVQNWVNSMDQRVLVHQLRHLLQMTTLNASESGLRALILRHLRKTAKNNTDRDKIDFLLVQYFALCAPPKIYHKQIELADAAQVMRPVLGDTEATPLAWCEPLEKMIESLRGFRSLREMLKTNFIEQGRRVKESAGGMFYDPSALLAFIRFNFLLRRTLIELMHADLIAIRSGLMQLEANGIRFLDGQRGGFSANESITRIRQAAEDWKQPFQKEYTERTVNQAFEKLLGLRADLERALDKLTARQSPERTAATDASALARPSSTSTRPLAADSTKLSAKGESPATLDFEGCMEQIWEQLIAAPPSRGRSMTTIRLGTARVLMSSWEVAAFVSEDGPSAEDLRRAVVARALVTAATESARETGNATVLDRALTVARVEVSRLLERVDFAKQAKDTEAAVNLGISAKRLVSAIDEAEQL
ncbi:MAG TPA: hypothetical protein VN749_08405 [Candidatus Eisenbacteria bacterium]|nr:hypothetical protein [Candidatus Eisenbacteria bacterium]